MHPSIQSSHWSLVIVQNSGYRMLNAGFVFLFNTVNYQSPILNPSKGGQATIANLLQCRAHFKTDVDKYRGETEIAIVPRT